MDIKYDFLSLEKDNSLKEGVSRNKLPVKRTLIL
jgi:hypothetical protein